MARGNFKKPMVETKTEGLLEEVALMVETKKEVKKATSEMFKKSIPNAFELRGYIVPNESFAMPDLSGEQKEAFDHAVKCGLITKV